MSGALLDDSITFTPVTDESPQDVTAARRRAERVLGRRIAPWPREVAMYRDAGLEPPSH